MKNNDKRKEMLAEIEDHFNKGEELLKKMKDSLRGEDPIYKKIESAIKVYESTYNNIEIHKKETHKYCEKKRYKTPKHYFRCSFFLMDLTLNLFPGGYFSLFFILRFLISYPVISIQLQDPDSKACSLPGSYFCEIKGP